MIIELGHSAFIAAIVILLLSFVVPIFLWKKSQLLTLSFLQLNNLLASILVIFAFVTLLYAFAQANFSLEIVALHSNQQNTLIYRMISLWSSYKGSVMLWISVYALYNIFFIHHKQANIVNKIWAIFINNIIFFIYLLFVLISNNPFSKNISLLSNNIGLNPLLHDPSMIFHPPTLYLGYVGFAMPFAITIACLINKTFSQAEIKWLQTWSLIVWMFLTIGITSGSFWAYYELGWGGWWFWDPVENASILPWLTCTALIHAIRSQRQSSNQLTVFALSIASYILSLIGVYITRSNIVQSVHSFALNNSQSNYILTYIIITTLIALLLLIRYGKKRYVSTPFKFYMNKSWLMAFNNYLLIVMASIILLGTLLPAFYNATLDIKFFNHLAIPVGILLLIAMVLVTQAYGNQKIFVIKLINNNALLCNIVLLSAVYLLFFTQPKHFIAILTFSLSLLLIFISLKNCINKTNNQLSMVISHIGFAVVIMGISIDSAFVQDKIIAFSKHKTIKWQRYTFELADIQEKNLPTKIIKTVVINVYNNTNAKIATLCPRQIFYQKNNLLINKTAIKQRFLSHIYIILGPMMHNQHVIQIVLHPFVTLIWLGGILIAIGGLCALINRKLKISHRLK